MIDRKNFSIWFGVVGLVLLISMTGLAWSWKRSRNMEYVHSRLEEDASRVAADVRARFALYEYGLRGARGSVIMLGEREITLAKFRSYMSTREHKREFPGSRGYGVIFRVQPAQERAFVARMEREGMPGFSIRQLTAHAGERFVISYIEPVEENKLAVGLDIASEANRRDAAERALKSLRPELTGPITLVQATGAPSRSMLLLLAIEDPAGGGPWGWVYSPLVVGEILASFDADEHNFGLELKDVSGPQAQTIFESARAREQDYKDAISLRRIEIFGRSWEAAVTPTAGYIAGLNLTSPAKFAAWISAATVCLLALAYVTAISRLRRARVIQGHLRFAAITEASQDAIIVTDAEGRVLEWNAGAEQIFGYGRKEAKGMGFSVMTCNAQQAAENAELFAQAISGRPVYDALVVRQNKADQPITLEMSLVAQRNGREVAVSARDVRERILAQEALVNLNKSLESKVEERTRQVVEYAALHSALINNAGYGIVIMDPEGRIRAFNGAAERLLGYAADEALGSSSILFFQPINRDHGSNDRTATKQSSHPVPASQVQDGEWVVFDKQGAAIPVLVRSSVLSSNGDAPIGHALTLVDLRDQISGEQALRQSESKLRALFELSPLGIVMHNEGGEMIECNQAFLAMTGLREEDALALTIRAITPRKYWAGDKDHLARAEADGVYGPYDKEFIRADGSEFPVRVSGIRFLSNEERYIWSIIEDTSLERQVRQSLRQAADAANEASAAKSNFLANMSHEIRTPMNAVTGMLQLMRLTKLDARQKDYVDKADVGAKLLLDIINDILDFSKIEAGKQTLERIEFNLDSLLRELAVIGSGTLGAKDVEFVIDVDHRLPPRVIGDPTRLRQVLTNLVGNAVKFTLVGEVVLRVSVESLSDKRVAVMFEVNDTGVGISPDAMQTIFEGFSQADSSMSRRFGGTGLGLAISSRLVQLMGGMLQVQSEIGRGSRFFFSIELPVAAYLDTPEYMLPPELRDIDVLVVDDNESARRSAVSMAGRLGWRAWEAESGTDAVSIVLEARDAGRPFSAVFMDWWMPGMDGWQASAAIRAALGDQAPLIVMTTAHGREALEARDNDQSESMNGFIIKPVTASLLATSLAETHAARTHGARDLSSQSGLSGMCILVVEDNPANQQVARELLESQGGSVDISASGQDALHRLKDRQKIYDVIIMDIQMPGLDGYQTSNAIRKELELNIPIIAMTANVLGDVREKCVAAGMQDYISKPFAIDDLVSKIRLVCGLAESTRVERNASSETSRDASSIFPSALVDPEAALNWEAALKRFGGDVHAYRNTLRSLPHNFGALRQEFTEGMSARNVEAVSRCLHTIKGVAGTFGANRLARLASTLEASSTTAQGLEWIIQSGGVGALQECIDMVRTSAVLLDERLGDEGEKITGSSREAGLDKLVELLSQSNMAAVAEFSRVEGWLKGIDAGLATELKNVIMNLDFSRAMQLCSKLKAR